MYVDGGTRIALPARRRGRLQAALLIGTILGCTTAGSAWGQELPPYQNLDDNYVDVVTGRFVFSFTEGAIGSGPGAVSLERGARADQWSGLLYRETTGGQSLMHVQLGSISDTFTINGTTYTPTKANGATLAYIGQSTWRYTASDGTRIDYKTAVGTSPFFSPYVITGPGCQDADPGTCGIPMSITRPDGMVFTLNWTYDLECGGNTLPCPDPKGWFRFRGVTSSAHYSFSLTYLTNDPGNFNAPQSDWFVRTGATFTNTLSPPSPLPTVSYAHPSSGVEEVTDSAGRVWRLTAAGTTYRIRRPGSTSDDIVVTYLPGGQVTSVTKDGVTTDYDRTVSGTTATMTVTDALGHVTTIVSDLSKGRPTSITDALGNTTSYTYDSAARLTKTEKPEGDSITYTYDARGNVTETRMKSKTPGTPADIVTSASYPSSCTNVVTCNSPTWTRDAEGNQTDYTYDTTTGQLLTVTAPAPTVGGTRPKTTYGYAAVNGVSLVQTISACTAGATCIGTANEAKTTIAYNGNLLPGSVTRASGTGSVSATTAYTYDPIGDVTTVNGPLSGSADTTTYRTNALRQVTGVIAPDPDGSDSLKRRAQRNSYDDVGRLLETEIGTVTGTSDTAWAAFVSKQQATSTYDGHGRKTKDVLTAGGTTYGVTQYSYDALGKLQCTAQRMNSAAWGSLPASACSLQTAGSAGSDRISRVYYDEVGRIEKTVSGYGTSVASNDAVATFTDNGKLATLTDGEGNKTTYTYDGFDRLVKTRYPSKTSAGTSSTTDYEQLGYDANGNVTSHRLRDGQTIAYAYDDLDRLVTKNLPGSEPTATYGYDLLGRPTSVSQGGTTLSFGYDALGRLLTQTGPHGTMTSTFDAAGRRTKLEWDDGFYVNYDHLVTGEVTKIRENGATSGIGVLASYTYDDLGNRIHATWGNGTASAWVPDPVGRLDTLVHNLAGTASDLTKTFAYNPAGGIASATSSNDSYAWPDAVNVNRAYTTNGLNQYTAAGSVSLGYDARGNLTSSGSDSYAYSSENLLESGPGVSLAYDPLMRLAEVTGGTTTGFAYDGLDLVAEYNASGTLTERYVHGPGTDEPIVWYEGAGTNDRRWLHADERGSIVAVTDDSGAALGINTYDEYGIPGAGNIGRFQYTGQTWLPELGMYYYKVRIYSPTLGRFIQTDPIGYADGMNLYGYAGGNPVNFIDPWGLNRFVRQTLADGSTCTVEIDDDGNWVGLSDCTGDEGEVTVTAGFGSNFGSLHLSPGPSNLSATIGTPKTKFCGVRGTGAYLGGSAEAGAVQDRGSYTAGTGGALQGSLSAVRLGNGQRGIFATSGMFYQAGGYRSSALSKTGTVLGASVGLGGGLVLTNAETAADYAGTSQTTNLNIGPISMSFSYGNSGVSSFNIGPSLGFGFSVSSFKTTTRLIYLNQC